MGQAWGINRTMAQVHALLFIAPEALDAGEISDLLGVSRSNVSTSLRELITWGVVRRGHPHGDRRARVGGVQDGMGALPPILAGGEGRGRGPPIAPPEHSVSEG